jgi:hypothetical protein
VPSDDLVECPKCHKPIAEEIVEEVDIGVGIQRFVTGWACGDCGLIATCNGCGRPEPDHAKWCDSLKHKGVEPYGFPYNQFKRLSKP